MRKGLNQSRTPDQGLLDQVSQCFVPGKIAALFYPTVLSNDGHKIYMKSCYDGKAISIGILRWNGTAKGLKTISVQGYSILLTFKLNSCFFNHCTVHTVLSKCAVPRDMDILLCQLRCIRPCIGFMRTGALLSGVAAVTVAHLSHSFLCFFTIYILSSVLSLKDGMEWWFLSRKMYSMIEFLRIRSTVG